jgi:uncharacterized protein (TIGR03083 family)
VDHLSFLEALRREAGALAGAGRGNLGAQVPACPDWTVAELLRHVHLVFVSKIRIVRERPSDWWEGPYPDPPPDDVLADEVVARADELATLLAEVSPDEPMLTWAEPHNAGFWSRRMAQEAAVHRADAEAATGVITPIDASLAADGIDEFLTVFLPQSQDAYKGDDGSTVHLHATDAPAEWVIEMGDRVVAREGHEKCAVAARGTASDLLLALWRREPASSLDIAGDAAALDRFLAVSDLS